VDEDSLALELLLLEDLLLAQQNDEDSDIQLDTNERNDLQTRTSELRATMETMIAEQLRIHSAVVQRATSRGSVSSSSSSSSMPVTAVSAAASSAAASSELVSTAHDPRLIQRLEKLLSEKRVKYRHVRTMLHALLRKVDWRKIGSGGGSHHVFHLLTTDAPAAPPLTIVKPHGGKVDMPARHVADVFRNLMRCIQQGFDTPST
jgi:hypothetical protein